MLNIQFPRAVGAWLNRLAGHDEPPHDTSDTVMRWPPTPSRVLISSERLAHKCIARALALEHPRGFLLAHVPLHKLVRVPRHQSYREWLSRTALLTVDFALCDEHGYVRAVVVMPAVDDLPRHVQRRERLMRVLSATDLPITLWNRAWQNEEAAELLCSTLFPKLQGSGFYTDKPQPH
jgi:hypothetical protein